MTRRSLVAGLFASAVSGASPLRLAYSFKGFPKWPLEKSFGLCAELGYSGVELFSGRGQEQEAGKLDVASVRSLVKRYRLPVVSLMEDLRLTGDDQAQQIQHLESSLDLARQISEERPPLIETVVGGKPEEWEKLRPLFLERLKVWARSAETYKVPVAIKAHIGSALHLPEDAAALCRQIGSPFLKLNYDFSHFQLQGLELESSLRAELPFIGMIHIKDSVGQPPKFRFVLPGEGSIDYRQYAALLKSVRYGGPVVVEVSSQVLAQPGYDAERAARSVASQMQPYFGNGSG